MEVIRRNINISEYQCLSTSEKLYVYDDSNTPVPNKLSDTFNPYRRILCEFVSPLKGLQEYNPFYTKKPNLSYTEIVSIYNKLLKYPKFMDTLCDVNCNLEPSVFIDEYIDLVDEYLDSVGEGNFLLSYTASLIYNEKDLPKLRIPDLSDQENHQLPFLYYLFFDYERIPYFNNEVSSFGIETMLGYEGEQIFIKKYIPSKDKIKLIIDILVNYIIENNKHGITGLRDIESEVRGNITNSVYDLAIEYYNKYGKSQEPLKIGVYNSYEYSSFPPKITIPILLTSTIEDLGISHNIVEEWVPGKRYYHNDVVLYEGLTYIFKDETDDKLPLDESGKRFFIGKYNSKENVIYFDNFNINGEGYTTSLIKNGLDFTHWKRNVNPITFESQTIRARIDSQLTTLRGYRDNTDYESFFDEDGKYKPGTIFNVEEYIDKNNKNIQYRSYIKDVLLKQTTNDGTVFSFTYNGIEYNNTFITNEIFTDSLNLLLIKFGIDYTTLGCDFVLYNYVIDECVERDNPTKIIHKGITFSDIYIRYKIGENNIYTYDYQQQPFIEYEINKYSYEKNGNHIIIGDDEVFNSGPQTKVEYENGIVFQPKVESDVFIDRGINYCFDKHLKLSECKSLTQLVKHANGSTFNVKNDTE